MRNKKILITCGPTWVPIDSVRVISNTSTGKMGHLIAQKLEQLGAEITLLEGPVRDCAQLQSMRVIKFFFYDELRRLLKEQLKKKYDVLIHCAAVSDYRLKKVFKNKLSSKHSQLNLPLVATEKLISEIRKLAPQIFLVGFKLAPTHSLKFLRSKSQELINQSQCDLVIANCIKNSEYHGYILDRSNNVLAKGKNREAIAVKLSKILCAKI